MEDDYTSGPVADAKGTNGMAFSLSKVATLRIILDAKDHSVGNQGKKLGKKKDTRIDGAPIKIVNHGDSAFRPHHQYRHVYMASRFAYHDATHMNSVLIKFNNNLHLFFLNTF